MANGIKIEKTRNAGSEVIESFGILADQVHVATEYLLEVLSGAKVSLMNDDDEGGEGMTDFRKTRKGFKSKSGGHGWQGEWVPMTRVEARQKILELAPANCGGHWSKLGTITRNSDPW